MKVAVNREEMGLQTSSVFLLDPSEYFSSTAEDLLVTAAYACAGRYLQTCDQLRELLTAYKCEFLALNANRTMCVCACLYANIYKISSYAYVG